MSLQKCTTSFPPPPDAVFCESSPSRSSHDRQRRAKKTFEEMMSYIPGIPLTFFFHCYLICSPPPPLLTTPLFERQMWDVCESVHRQCWLHTSLAVFVQMLSGNVSERRPSMKECVFSSMDCSSQFWTNRYTRTVTQNTVTQTRGPLIHWCGFVNFVAFLKVPKK